MPEQYFTPEELATEEWRSCPTYEDIYDVSNLGRVRRSKSASNIRWAGRILHPTPSSQYPRYTMHKDFKQRAVYIHVLTAIAFIAGPRQPGQEVNHKDGHKWNGRVTNLEWVTRKGNVEHAVKAGLFANGDRNGTRLYPERVAKGERCGRAKLTSEKVKTIRALLRDGGRPDTLASLFNVSVVTIYHIRNRHTWKHLD